MPPSRGFPPVEFCRGTSPSQAANSRPLRKPLGSTTVAAMAVAMIGPMPGTLARRWLIQSHLVAKRAQLPPRVVRRRARLQANQTGRQSTEERQNLRTPKLLAQNRRSLCIDPVHLKNMLRQVQSDRGNLAHGWLPFAAVSIRQQFGTQMLQGGHPPHHSRRGAD